MSTKKQHTKLNVFRLQKKHNGEPLFYIKKFSINPDATDI